MRTRVFLCCCLVSMVSGCALQAPGRRPTVPTAITESRVRSHMEFLAGDALNGRGSGTRDERIAASYAASLMQQWGLEPIGDGGYVEEVEIERLEATAPPVLSYEGGRLTHGKEMRVTALGAPRVSGPLQKYVAGTPIKPGAVLLMPATVRTSAASGDSGAVATLALESSVQAPSSAGMRLPQLAARIVGVEGSAPFRPTGVLLDKDAYATIGALAEGQTITIEATVKPSATTQTWNAVARLTGSDPAAAREVILLSAHIDHLGIRPSVTPDPIYNGADDDASGTVAVLELAHALASGPRPKRTIVFALFGSEESGGYGSRYFADRPVVPLTQIVANLEFEMIGRPDPKVAAHTLWLTGYERSNLGPALAKQGARLVQDPHPEQNFFTRSDNIQFARRGVIAHTVSSYGLHKQYHQPSDELTLIDFPHMTESIQSMLAPIRWLSNSTFRPQWVPGQKP